MRHAMVQRLLWPPRHGMMEERKAACGMATMPLAWRRGRWRARSGQPPAPVVLLWGAKADGCGMQQVIGRGGLPSSTTCRCGARAALMEDGGGAAIPDRGASETSGNWEGAWGGGGASGR